MVVSIYTCIANKPKMAPESIFHHKVRSSPNGSRLRKSKKVPVVLKEKAKEEDEESWCHTMCGAPKTDAGRWLKQGV